MSTDTLDTLDALEAHVASLELRAARQASHEAVERQQRAYGYYVDKGRWSAAAARWDSASLSHHKLGSMAA